MRGLSSKWSSSGTMVILSPLSDLRDPVSSWKTLSYFPPLFCGCETLLSKWFVFTFRRIKGEDRGRKCRTKTMTSRKTCEDQRWVYNMCRLVRGRREKDDGRGEMVGVGENEGIEEVGRRTEWRGRGTMETLTVEG